MFNEAIAQLFHGLTSAGIAVGARAVRRRSAKLPWQVQVQVVVGVDLPALHAVGLAPVEMLDLLRAVALLALGNRLMRNLGETVLFETPTVT